MTAHPRPSQALMPAVPMHWTPEQATLAVLECLQTLREALWASYGPQVQQAWRDKVAPYVGVVTQRANLAVRLRS